MNRKGGYKLLLCSCLKQREGCLWNCFQNLLFCLLCRVKRRCSFVDLELWWDFDIGFLGWETLQSCVHIMTQNLRHLGNFYGKCLHASWFKSTNIWDLWQLQSWTLGFHRSPALTPYFNPSHRVNEISNTMWDFFCSMHPFWGPECLSYDWFVLK